MLVLLLASLDHTTVSTALPTIVGDPRRDPAPLVAGDRVAHARRRLGLGMVMQVLVLAAQNAVEYRLLGVATSGSTLFRQVGGSVGVSLFGAIFASRLAHELAARLPLGAHLPAAANPAAVRRRQA